MDGVKGIFKAKYGDQLKGADWVRRIDPEDQRVLIDIGLQAFDHGRQGGRAQAERGLRDPRGRFTRGGFREQYGRDPVPGEDYDPEAVFCQDDYEYFTSTGRYAAVRQEGQNA